jgi:hypothetical protein
MRPINQEDLKALLLALLRDDKQNGGLLSADTLKKAAVLWRQLDVEIPTELAG